MIHIFIYLEVRIISISQNKCRVPFIWRNIYMSQDPLTPNPNHLFFLIWWSKFICSKSHVTESTCIFSLILASSWIQLFFSLSIVTDSWLIPLTIPIITNFVPVQINSYGANWLIKLLIDHLLCSLKYS